MSTSARQEGRTDSISPADEGAVKQVLMESVLGLWDLVNNLARLEPSRRDRYRGTIFGSARARSGTFGYEEAKRVATPWPRASVTSCGPVSSNGPDRPSSLPNRRWQTQRTSIPRASCPATGPSPCSVNITPDDSASGRREERSVACREQTSEADSDTTT